MRSFLFVCCEYSIFLCARFCSLHLLEVCFYRKFMKLSYEVRKIPILCLSFLLI
jgi:hypothetical protein